ncbi:MAG: hypothetical protein Q9187_003085 [Circinaria calcarea]
MGAVNKLDLTSDVTHLIVGFTDTPKYKYVAKERPDVKCLLPEWIEAVRESWMRGGETEVEALEVEYRLPTFAGLRVCVTGFEDLVLRKQLEEALKNNGGEYRKDLTKDVTHLIAHKPEGSKYKAANSWGIRVVSIEWLHQSLERGMILDESLYDPLLSASERGRNAWVRESVSTSSLVKRPREDELTQGPVRKLRRTASTKFSSQNDGIWTDIVGGGFGPGLAMKSEWDDQSKEPIGINNERSYNVKPEKHSSNSSSLGLQNKPLSQPEKPWNVSSVTEPSSKRALFHGKSFYLHGFDTKKTTILQGHLRSHGADIVKDLGEFSQIPTIGSADGREKTRHALEWNIPVVKAEWLWDCICIGKKLSFDGYYIHPSQQGKPRDEKDAEAPKNRGSSDSASDRCGSRIAKQGTVAVNETPIEGAAGLDQTIEMAEAIKTEAGSTDETFLNCDDDGALTPNPPKVHASSGNLETASAHSVSYKPSPLHELSPNSPPKPSRSQAKPSPTKPRPSLDSQDSESLMTAISSLLAHHQRESSNPPPPVTSEQPRLGRRKRQLFGRVPSNLSARSNSINLSRASSVDTLNTDGLGTPLEAAHSARIPAKTECKNSITASVLASYSEEMEQKEDEEAKQRLQSTQLGYEDPEAGAWRAKLMNKMGGRGKEVEVRVKGIGTVRDEAGLGAPQSVSTRTRRSGAR